MLIFIDMQNWDGFRKVRPHRSCYVCGGCDGSWIWADRVNDLCWCCDHCGRQWPTGKMKHGSPNASNQRQRKKRTRKVEAPPGLGGRDKKPSKHPVDDMLK